MKYSRYNYLFKSEKFGYLLYNSVTNSFASVNKALYGLLNEIKRDIQKVTELDEQTIQYLKTAKILVNQFDDEDYIYQKRLKYLAVNQNRTSLNLTIAPTRGCNFNCPYCYEDDRKNISMTEEVEANLLTFIESQNVKHLNITWYGGEPLMAFKNIQRIVEKVENLDIKFTHSIITNGYLLTERVSRYFKDHPLNKIQITIDGNKQTHNQRRVLLSGGGTYERIIKNIDTFLKHNDTHVAIRVNLDDKTLYEFVDVYEMAKRNWGKKVHVYPAFVNDHINNRCAINNNGIQKDFFLKLNSQYGIKLNNYPRFQVGGCIATQINGYVVGPEGELYKCWNDIGIKEKIIGNVNSSKIINQKVLANYLAGETAFDDKKCLDCHLLPICNGGCVWKRIGNSRKGGNFIICPREKGYLNHYLEMHYENKLNGKTAISA